MQSHADAGTHHRLPSPSTGVRQAPRLSPPLLQHQPQPVSLAFPHSGAASASCLHPRRRPSRLKQIFPQPPISIPPLLSPLGSVHNKSNQTTMARPPELASLSMTTRHDFNCIGIYLVWKELEIFCDPAKLTKYFREKFDFSPQGDHSQIALLCYCSLRLSNVTDSLSTLQFGESARRVINNREEEGFPNIKISKELGEQTQMLLCILLGG